VVEKAIQMKTTILLAIVALCAGCKMTRGEYTTPSGVRVRFSDVRCGLNTGAEAGVSIASNGVTQITVKAQSAPDVALAEGIARGVASGFNPSPLK
jgi:hypothetical protein